MSNLNETIQDKDSQLRRFHREQEELLGIKISLSEDLQGFRDLNDVLNSKTRSLQETVLSKENEVQE